MKNYSKKSYTSKSYEPEERTLLEHLGAPSHISQPYPYTADGKRYNVKTKNTLFKARIKKKTYLDI